MALDEQILLDWYLATQKTNLVRTTPVKVGKITVGMYLEMPHMRITNFIGTPEKHTHSFDLILTRSPE